MEGSAAHMQKRRSLAEGSATQMKRRYITEGSEFQRKRRSMIEGSAVFQRKRHKKIDSVVDERKRRTVTSFISDAFQAGKTLVQNLIRRSIYDEKDSIGNKRKRSIDQKSSSQRKKRDDYISDIPEGAVKMAARSDDIKDIEASLRTLESMEKRDQIPEDLNRKFGSFSTECQQFSLILRSSHLIAILRSINHQWRSLILKIGSC